MRLRTNVLERNNVQIKGNTTAERTLLFAHGFGTDQTAWSNIWPSFAETCRIVLFDYVGTNQTTVSHFSFERYNNLYAFADDLLDIVETLDLTNIILVGHSVGGTTGLLASIQESKRFSGLVLVGSSPRYLNDTAYTGGFTQADLDSLFTQMTGNYYGWASGFAPIIAQNADQPDLAASFARTLSDMRPDVGLALARLIFQSDHRADLHQVTHPVLILQPGRDVAVPQEVGHFLAQNIQHSQLTILNTEGHLPHLSHPDLVIAAIRSFIEHVPVHGLETI